MALVHHAIGTTDNSRVWIDEWTEHMNLRIPERCPCCGKLPSHPNKIIGAHVNLYSEMAIPPYRKRVFITPTCKECNDTYKFGKAWDCIFWVNNNLLLEI